MHELFILYLYHLQYPFLLQIYTAFGPTLIAPTWFISRSIYNQFNGFNESIKSGYPEDLDFFYKSLSLSDIKLCRMNEPMLFYRYHTECATIGVKEETIWNIRIKQIEKSVLSKWSKITIWNAGKQGKKLHKYFTDCGDSLLYSGIKDKAYV